MKSLKTEKNLASNGKIILFAALFLGATAGNAGVIISETFDTDGNINDYTGAGKVFAQTTISGDATGVVSGGVLTMAQPNTGAGTLYSRIDLGVPPGIDQAASNLIPGLSLMSMQIDVRGDNYNATINSGGFGAATGSFDVHSNFSSQSTNGSRNFATTWVNDGPSYNMKAEDGTNTEYTIPGVAVGAFHTWTTYLNQSGSTQNFFGPDGSIHSLDTDRWSFFFDNTLLADNVVKGSGGYDSDSIKGVMLWTGKNYSGATSITSIDNIVIRDDLAIVPVPVPEIGTISLMLIALAGLLAIRR